MSRSGIAIAALVAGLLGFALGWGSAPREAPPPRTSRAPAPAGETAAATHAALMTRDPLPRAAALAELLSELGPEGLEPVREAYESVLLDAADWEVQLFVEWWASFDPRAATDWAYGHHLGRHPSVMATALRSWARRDPSAARTWLDRTVVADNLRYPALVALLWGWDESGQPGLWDYVVTFRDELGQQYVLGELVRRRLLRDGAEATFRWADRMPDDEPGDPRRLKLNTFRRIGAKLAEIDPSLAVAWAEQVGEGEYGDGVYRKVAVKWVRSNGRAAMTWLGTLPPGPRRDEAVSEGFRRWLNRRRAAALEWLAQQPPDPWLDPARLWHAASVGGRDPEEGLALAEGIHDELLRGRAMFLTLRGWRHRDREAADAWIAEHELPEKLLENLERFPLRESRRGDERAGVAEPDLVAEDLFAPELD